MDARNPRGVTCALPASFEEIGYLMDRDWADKGNSVQLLKSVFYCNCDRSKQTLECTRSSGKTIPTTAYVLIPCADSSET
ncbi:hypothetical protein EVAR_7189_1 [Eumeta japonica]|uniref:Uncharacterized protein n=1 Tax=Eumeta variegata TaxID=151549 RepID=A0A4C1U6H3_EUMVA|nr:hypothetical protein EVAR_7189_1 [Eumeta japonica]